MVSYTALYQAAAFDMCQLTERFANIDSLVGHVNLDDRTMCSDPVERLPNDTVVSLNECSFFFPYYCFK